MDSNSPRWTSGEIKFTADTMRGAVEVDGEVAEWLRPAFLREEVAPMLDLLASLLESRPTPEPPAYVPEIDDLLTSFRQACEDSVSSYERGNLGASKAADRERERYRNAIRARLLANSASSGSEPVTVKFSDEVRTKSQSASASSGSEEAREVCFPGRVHELKCWPRYFTPLNRGIKTFEIRKDDREPGFAAGDVLHLREWVPEEDRYTGRECWRQVTYLARGGFIPQGSCVMSIVPARAAASSPSADTP